jgi:DNA polymerase-3 subunit delta
MNHTEFFKAVKSGQIGTLYLMEGVEEYIKQSALEQLRKAILPVGLEALNETVLENPSLQVLRAAVETLPFMADRRLVLVRECTLLRPSRKGSEEGEEAPEEDDQTQAYCSYLADLPPTTCLVFYEKGKADARRKLYGAIKKNGTIALFDTLDNEELNRWIIQFMRSIGKEISPSVASNLAFTVGRDAALLRGEMEKLAAHTGERPQVTAEDIQAVATRSLEASVFDLVDALVEGKAPKAFSLFENMLRTGGSRFAILAMILRQYRILFHYKTLKESNAPLMDIRSRLGIPPFAVDRAAKQAAAYTSGQLQGAITLCVDTEFSVKSGRMAEEGSVERAMLLLSRLKEGDTEKVTFTRI